VVLKRLVWWVLFASSVLAQTFNGNLAGTVSDASGAALPGANLQLTNPSTGLALTAKSSADGNYLFVDLPVGSYTVTVSAAGFQTKRSIRSK
jgi:hypothetical protein